MRSVQSFIIFSWFFFSSLQCMFGLFVFWFVTVGSDIRFYFLDWFSWWKGKIERKKIMWKKENWLSVSHRWIFFSVRVTTLIPSEDLIYCATVKAIFVSHTLSPSLARSLLRCCCESHVFVQYTLQKREHEFWIQHFEGKMRESECTAFVTVSLILQWSILSGFEKKQNITKNKSTYDIRYMYSRVCRFHQ